MVGSISVVLPVIMEQMEKRTWFRRAAVFHLPFQTFMIGVLLVNILCQSCLLKLQEQICRSCHVNNGKHPHL